MHRFKHNSSPRALSSMKTVKLMCSYCLGKAFCSLSPMICPKAQLYAGICSVSIPRMAGKTQLAARITWESSTVNCKGHIYLLSC